MNRFLSGLVLLSLALGAVACQTPKKAPQPDYDAVRQNSEAAGGQLRQEEQRRDSDEDQ